MRAMTVVPGRKGTAGVETLDEPPIAQGELLVSGRLLGVCGTDRESPRESMESRRQARRGWC
jgi:glucose 1-dehydrogenase